MRLLAFGVLAVFPALAGAAADGLSAKPVPGNKPCPYPAEAQRRYVAGPVRFLVRVRPDGTAESVEVRKVPLPDLGFEDTVRACVSEWRFEPAPAGGAGLRSYEGQLRFRLEVTEEPAIRALLETLAAAWNAGDAKAVDDLALRPGDGSAVPPEGGRSLREQIEGERTATPWRMELEPDVDHLRFLRPDLVSVRQPYRRIAAGGQSGQAREGEAATLDALAAKGARGWRFVRVLEVHEVAQADRHVGEASQVETGRPGARVGGRIREPRKIKDVKPVYPDYARESRLQGLVILECVISPEGKVTNVRVLRGIHKGLDQAAIDAVRRWEYTPTLLDGKAVPVIMTVTVNFKLSYSSRR